MIEKIGKGELLGTIIWQAHDGEALSVQPGLGLNVYCSSLMGKVGKGELLGTIIWKRYHIA